MINTEAIDLFLKRVQECQKVRAKEVRLTLQEAQDISISLSLLQNRNVGLLEQINQLQDQSIKHQSQPGPIQVGMDGGGF